RAEMPEEVRALPNLYEELRRLPGVHHIELNSFTTTLLLLFDPEKTSPGAVLDRLLLLTPRPPEVPPPVVDFPVVSSSPGRLRIHLTRRLGARWRFLDQ